jgi:hypothetical protein
VIHKVMLDNPGRFQVDREFASIELETAGNSSAA